MCCPGSDGGSGGGHAPDPDRGVHRQRQQGLVPGGRDHQAQGAETVRGLDYYLYLVFSIYSVTCKHVLGLHRAHARIRGQDYWQELAVIRQDGTGDGKIEEFKAVHSVN